MRYRKFSFRKVLSDSNPNFHSFRPRLMVAVPLKYASRKKFCWNTSIGVESALELKPI